MLMILGITAVFAQDELPPVEIPPEEPPIEVPTEEVPPGKTDPGLEMPAPLPNCVGECPVELVVYGCLDINAVNWLGTQAMWEGWTMVGDGSCICMNYSDDVGAYEVPCGQADGSYHEMLSWAIEDFWFTPLGQALSVIQPVQLQIVTEISLDVTEDEPVAELTVLGMQIERMPMYPIR